MDLRNYTTRKTSDNACRLCDSQRNVDFHHWDYQSDIGTYLCRDCHNYIHEPEGARPSDSMGASWLWPAIDRLLERHIDCNKELPTEEDFINWYNMPSDFSGIVEQVFKNRDTEDFKRQYRKRALKQRAEIEEQLEK